MSPSYNFNIVLLPRLTVVILRFLVAGLPHLWLLISEGLLWLLISEGHGSLIQIREELCEVIFVVDGQHPVCIDLDACLAIVDFLVADSHCLGIERVNAGWLDVWLYARMADRQTQDKVYRPTQDKGLSWSKILANISRICIQWSKVIAR